ncbi:MAG: 50S ribosomal protein L4 [Chloroflexota bacterium]|nr:50S ribosomal protein L4 [Chloroflexota bacterium]
MEVSVYDTSGKAVDTIDIDDSVFNIPFNKPVVHQAVVRQLTNARAGTASTKTRGNVRGSTRKPFRQKHTGWARRGTVKSPLLRGGGVIFGPHPRVFNQKMPKKMRQLALRCVLSDKAREDRLVLIDELTLGQAKTKEMANILEAVKDIFLSKAQSESGREKSSFLVVTLEPEEAVIRACNNLHRVKTLPAPVLNVADIISHKYLVMTVPAAREVEIRWGKHGSV